MMIYMIIIRIVALWLKVIWFVSGDNEVIEGDIVMDDQLKRVVEMALTDKANNHMRKRRDAVMNRQMKWDDAFVPYVIDQSVGMKHAIVYIIHFVIFIDVNYAFYYEPLAGFSNFLCCQYQCNCCWIWFDFHL